MFKDYNSSFFSIYCDNVNGFKNPINFFPCQAFQNNDETLIYEMHCTAGLGTYNKLGCLLKKNSEKCLKKHIRQWADKSLYRRT